jgi:hypothetical protein
LFSFIAAIIISNAPSYLTALCGIEAVTSLSFAAAEVSCRHLLPRRHPGGVPVMPPQHCGTSRFQHTQCLRPQAGLWRSEWRCSACE